MDEQFLTGLYSKYVDRHIHHEKAMEFTRNLSVFIIAGMMYFIFGFPETSSHLIAILGSLTVFVLQVFESREFSKNLNAEKNIRILEGFFFNKNNESHEKLIEKLSADNQKNFHSLLFSFAGTIYYNYILIFLALDVCWFSKLYLYPIPADTLAEFLNRPAFGFLPGWFFYAFAVVFWITYFSLAAWYRIKIKKHED